MSSSDSLLPLLNQLQVMEDTLVNFMCETIIKLQSLTDVKVFLLVDYPQRNKRRYCGSQELVETFQREKGPNFCVTTDVEVELDKSATGLIEKQAWRPPHHVHGSADSTVSSAPANPSIPAFADHISNASKSLDDKSPTLKRKSTNATLDNVVDNDYLPSKKSRPNCDDVETNRNDFHLKEETSDIPEYVISDDDQDINDYSTFALQNDTQANMDAFSLRNDSIGGPNLGDSQGNHDLAAEPHCFFHSLHAPERELIKLNSLIGLPDPGVLYEKGSMESRVFISVCYSVGKNAALNCPHPFTRENKEVVQSFWSHHCDIFVAFCSRAGLLVDRSQVDVKRMDCLKKNTALGFIRSKFRDGFKKVATRGQGYF